MTEYKELIKDRDCLKCKKFFDCEGKPRGNKNCLNFEERKKERGKFDGRE